MIRRLVLALLLSVFLSPHLPASAADMDPGQFITDLADKALTTLTDPSIDETVRADRFRALLNEGLDTTDISERSLGAYVRRATEPEMQTFRALLEENVVLKYAILFKGYSAKKIELVNTKAGRNNNYLVTIRVHQVDGSPPVTVRWEVRAEGSSYKITDIVVERASMVTTMKDDFVSVIRRGGGKISALLDELRERNAELMAKSAG